MKSADRFSFTMMVNYNENYLFHFTSNYTKNHDILRISTVCATRILERVCGRVFREAQGTFVKKYFCCLFMIHLCRIPQNRLQRFVTATAKNFDLPCAPGNLAKQIFHDFFPLSRDFQVT